MEGPNVNWKFLEQFQSELKRNSNITLLNVGSCGLHVVNGFVYFGKNVVPIGHGNLFWWVLRLKVMEKSWKMIFLKERSP